MSCPGWRAARVGRPLLVDLVVVVDGVETDHSLEPADVFLVQDQEWRVDRSRTRFPVRELDGCACPGRMTGDASKSDAGSSKLSGAPFGALWRAGGLPCGNVTLLCWSVTFPRRVHPSPARAHRSTS
ncbi:DUF6406 domain-containing protein [Streptomyces sp. NBC_01485]|uniref:DUF6406 domain-containing protein n=1 Tax=Streptomyces sp. NBC_01485 TaxID=2903884 RepID=UPI003FCD2052